MSTWPAQTTKPNGTALVVGGNGFIAGFIIARLRRNGWTVKKGVRQVGRFGHGTGGDDHSDEVACDLQQLLTPQDWYPLLDGVDAVVNAAGILREENGQTFDVVHYQAPLALAQACVDKNISRFVQISALGAPGDGEFIASKHRLDRALQDLELDAVILRPSVVYSTAGSYGGTSLLRGLAGFPLFHLVPGNGKWQIQPVAGEDLGRIAAEAVDQGRDGIYEIGCREPLSLRDYQRTWRKWMRIPGGSELELPEGLVDSQIATWEMVGKGPVGVATWNMLRRGNTTHPGAWEKALEAFGTAPASVEQVLGKQPSQVQDRWQAQLYFLGPVLTFMLALVWIISGAAGIVKATAGVSLMNHFGITGDWAMTLIGVMGVADLALASWLAFSKRPRLVLGVMAVQTLLYTVALGAFAPLTWLDPLGGLAKNLVILPALGVAWVLADRR